MVATPSAQDVAAQVEEVVERLRGAPTEVPLPFERSGAAKEETSLLGTTITTGLDPERTAGALAVASEEGCTTFMLGVALLAGTLARRSTQRDFLIAFAWPGRDHPDAADVIGMFITTVVLRVSLEPDTTWRELLGNARISSMEAFMDSDVPLDAISARLNPDRNALWPPLTPVLLNLDDAPHAPVLAPGVTGLLRVRSTRSTSSTTSPCSSASRTEPTDGVSSCPWTTPRTSTTTPPSPPSCRICGAAPRT